MNDEYTSEQWRQILANAHKALAADPSNERARAALKAAIPFVEQDNEAISQQEMSEAQDPGALGTFGLGFSQATTAGFGDEVGGLLAAAGALLPGGESPGEAYRSQVDETRDALNAGTKNHLGARVLGEIGGTAATLIPSLAGSATRLGIQGAGALARAANPVARLLGGGRVARIAGRVATGAAVGAGGAALETAGRTEGDVGERLDAAGDALPIGAILGGTLGVGVPLALAGGKAVVRGVRSKVGSAVDAMAGKPLGPKRVKPVSGLEDISETSRAGANQTVDLRPTLPPPKDPMDTPTHQRRGTRPAGETAPKPSTGQAHGSVGPNHWSGTKVKSSPNPNSETVNKQISLLQQWLEGTAPEDIPAKLDEIRSLGIALPKNALEMLGLQ